MGVESIGLANALFSKTQQRILALLFGNSHRSFYANEIVRAAGSGIGAVLRELDKLASVGLLNVQRIGNQKHYRANPDSPIFEELRAIVAKTFGVADVLRNALQPYHNDIKFAFLFGSLAKNTDKAGSDIDLLIVTDRLSYSDVFGSLADAEQLLKRKVNPKLYKKEEFAALLSQDNSFVVRVLQQPKIFIVGSEDDIPKSQKPNKVRAQRRTTRPS